MDQEFDSTRFRLDIINQHASELALIHDLKLMRKPNEIMKPSLLRFSKYSNKEQLLLRYPKIIYDVSVELLKNDRFQVQISPASMCLIKKDETKSGFEPRNIERFEPCIAKLHVLLITEFDNLIEFQTQLLSYFQAILQNNYIVMYEMIVNDIIAERKVVSRFSKVSYTKENI
jgi:hypothetical protein